MPEFGRKWTASTLSGVGGALERNELLSVGAVRGFQLLREQARRLGRTRFTAPATCRCGRFRPTRHPGCAYRLRSPEDHFARPPDLAVRERRWLFLQRTDGVQRLTGGRWHGRVPCRSDPMPYRYRKRGAPASEESRFPVAAAYRGTRRRRDRAPESAFVRAHCHNRLAEPPISGFPDRAGGNGD